MARLRHFFLRFSVRFLRGGGIAGGNVSLECDTPAKMAAESLCTKDKNRVSSNSFVTFVTHVTFVTSDSFNPFISCDSCSRIEHSLSKNSWFYFFVSLALHYLCFAKIGCGSAKAFKQAWVPALALHYLCFAKIGCGSAKAFKQAWVPALALHYLCFAKIGCGSAKAFKQAWVPALTLHYLCFAIL